MKMNWEMYIYIYNGGFNITKSALWMDWRWWMVLFVSRFNNKYVIACVCGWIGEWERERRKNLCVLRWRWRIWRVQYESSIGLCVSLCLWTKQQWRQEEESERAIIYMRTHTHTHIIHDLTTRIYLQSKERIWNRFNKQKILFWINSKNYVRFSRLFLFWLELGERERGKKVHGCWETVSSTRKSNLY